MTISFFIAGIINIGIVRLRWWFFRTVIGRHSQWLTIFAISIATSTLLALFPQISRRTGIDAWDYTHYISSLEPTLLLILGVVAIASIVAVVLWQRPSKFNLFVHLAFVIITLIIMQLTGSILSAGLIARLIVALIEEWTKTGTNLVLRDKYQIVRSDIILIWLIVTLGFAFSENIIYLWRYGAGTIGVSIGIVLKRSITSRVMHIMYTGVISLGILTMTEKTYGRVWMIGALLLSLTLHGAYNFVLEGQHILVTILLLLGGYFFLSRLVYRSERVYLPTHG